MLIQEKNVHLIKWFAKQVGLDVKQGELRRKISLFFVLLGIISVTIPEVLNIFI